MGIKAVLFDLDGTLLPLEQKTFTKAYFSGLSKKLVPHGYEPQTLIASIWKGISAMVSNDGTKTNEQVFWQSFKEDYGDNAERDKGLFEEFYINEFNDIRNVCGFTAKSRELIDRLKSLGYRTVVATNPLFPAVATEARIRWAGLEPSDFEFYTTYENSGHCKPNPDYYTEIAKKLGVDTNECLMVGNDVTEDMVAQSVGMQVFLLTDCIINDENRDISVYQSGSFDDLMKMF